MDDAAAETAEDNRAVWVQVGAEDEGQEPEGPAGTAARAEAGDGEGPSAPPASRKRPLEAVQDDEDELEDDVKKRLAALRGDA